MIRRPKLTRDPQRDSGLRCRGRVEVRGMVGKRDLLPVEGACLQRRVSLSTVFDVETQEN